MEVPYEQTHNLSPFRQIGRQISEMPGMHQPHIAARNGVWVGG